MHKSPPSKRLTVSSLLSPPEMERSNSFGTSMPAIALHYPSFDRSDSKHNVARPTPPFKMPAYASPPISPFDVQSHNQNMDNGSEQGTLDPRCFAGSRPLVLLLQMCLCSRHNNPPKRSSLSTCNLLSTHNCRASQKKMNTASSPTSQPQFTNKPSTARLHTTIGAHKSVALKSATAGPRFRLVVFRSDLHQRSLHLRQPQGIVSPRLLYQRPLLVLLASPSLNAHPRLSSSTPSKSTLAVFPPRVRVPRLLVMTLTTTPFPTTHHPLSHSVATRRS